jgi:hypothetical protein
MNKKTKIRITIFVMVLLALLSVTAISTNKALADSSSIVRLTVDNASQFHFILYLYGETWRNEYSMSVPAYTDSKIFIQPDTYSYYMEACNYSTFGTMDLSVFQTIHVPVCGGKAAGYHNKAHHIDVSTIMKPVWIKIRNQTGETVELYLRTQDDHHFLTIQPGEILEVLLKKVPGIQYVYSFQACGGQLISGYYIPRQTPPLDLKCP